MERQVNHQPSSILSAGGKRNEMSVSSAKSAVSSLSAIVQAKPAVSSPGPAGAAAEAIGQNRPSGKKVFAMSPSTLLTHAMEDTLRQQEFERLKRGEKNEIPTDSTTIVERFRMESLHPKAKLGSNHTQRDDTVLEGPDTAKVVPDESMLRHASDDVDLGQMKTFSRTGCILAYESDLPPVPTCIVPLSKARQVLLMIGNSFLRVGHGNMPMVSKIRPPLYPNCNYDSNERLLDPRGPPERVPEKFNFPDYTFYVDETATLMESWYRNTRAFFNVRIAVWRSGKYDREYLALCLTGGNRCHLQYHTSQSGTWWQLSCVGHNRFVCESVTKPGICLTKDCFGLSLTAPLTAKDRNNIRKARVPNDAVLTMLPLPSFAVWRPGVIVS